MMAKWIGAVVIICACTGFGFRMKRTQIREEMALQEIQEIVCYMTGELQYHLTPLPVLCHKVCANCSGNLRKIFDVYAEELDKQLSPDPYACMLATLEQFTDIPDSAENLIRNLGKSLGKLDLESQLRALNGIQEECERCLKKLRTNQDVRFRTYQTLGLCAGAALAILFV